MIHNCYANIAVAQSNVLSNSSIICISVSDILDTVFDSNCLYVPSI